jgi:uncharacterized protein YjbJ (UPF0337 family)
MSDFTNPLRERKGRALSKMSKGKLKKQSLKGHTREVAGTASGNDVPAAQGHAFQVNDPPQQADEEKVVRGHGAEGHAFQVNDPPQKADE